MDNREKEGKMEIQKFKYLKNKSSFLDEIESIFHSFWRAILCWKKLSIVDTSILRKLTKSKTDFCLPKSCFIFFLYLEKWLDKKSNVNYKIYDVTGWTTLPNIPRSKGNQTGKFGQLIEYVRKCGEEASATPFWIIA